MPNSLSFFLTTTQMRSRSKTVTRRLRCKLKPGELFWAVVKKQGLKKGEKVERIVLCRCLKNDPSVLNGPDLTIADVAREGFPEMSPVEFVAMFVKHMKCAADEEVRRVAFEFVESEAAA